MKKFLIISVTLLVMAGTYSCSFGNQKVIWTKSEPLNYDYGSEVILDSTVIVPDDEMDFMQRDIETAIRSVLRGDAAGEDVYTIKVVITKFEKGSAFARFILIGLGQMYLYGTVEVSTGEPPQIVRVGEFKKNYRVGGFIGGFAKMHDSLVNKVGKAIAEALQQRLPKP